MRDCLVVSAKLIASASTQWALTSENFFANKYLSSSMSSASTVDHANNCVNRSTQGWSYMGRTKVEK